MFLDRILQICCVLTLTIGVVSYAPRCNGLVSLTPNGLSLKRNSNDFLQMHTKQHKRVHELNGRTYLADGQVDSKYTNSKIMIKVLGTLAATLVSFKKPAFAAAMDKALNVGDIKGWDLYGRVPFDDWIFSTARLTNPEILKRSIVEVVSQEIPIVLGTFNRRKAIFTGLVLAKGVVFILGGLALLGIVVMKARESMRLDRLREAEIRGFYTPVSAAYKGARNKGKEVEGVQGWIDMSRRNPRSREPDEEEEKENEEEGKGDERKAIEKDMGKKTDKGQGADDTGPDEVRAADGDTNNGKPGKSGSASEQDKKGKDNKGSGSDGKSGPTGKGPKGKGPSGGGSGKGRGPGSGKGTSGDYDDMYDDL